MLYYVHNALFLATTQREGIALLWSRMYLAL